MAGSFYQLGKHDARHLATMIDQLSDARNREKRAHMILFCWSRMMKNGNPCPCFTLGIRTIADECGAREHVARSFIDRAEQMGWMLRVGTVRKKWPGGGGEFVKRTFAWVAEEAASAAGMSLGEWLESVGVCEPNSTPPTLETAHPQTKAQQSSADPRAKSPCGNSTHQSTEYSEKCTRYSSSTGTEYPEPIDPSEYDVDVTPSWLVMPDA